MKFNGGHPAVQVLDAVDKVMFAKPGLGLGAIPVTDIGDRIAFGRHASTATEMPDRTCAHNSCGSFTRPGVHRGAGYFTVFGLRARRS